MGIFLCLLDLFVHLICTCCSLTGCSFQLFVFSQYFFRFQIRSSFSSLKQDISVLKRKEEKKQIQKLQSFIRHFPHFQGQLGTGGSCLVFSNLQSLALLQRLYLPLLYLFLALCLRFSSTCQQYLLKLQQTQGRSTLPWLFFTKLGNLHVVRQSCKVCLFSLKFYRSVPSIKLNLCLR